MTKSVALLLIRSLLAITAVALMGPLALAGEQKTTPNPNKTESVPKTPLAAYQKQVTDAIGTKWYQYTQLQPDLLSVGTVRMDFRILANGHVTGVKIVSNTSNETFATLCKRAVLESKFPPIPDSVRRQLGHDFLDWEGVNFKLLR
jgi:outer membrane biosynthesis protein TonB